MKQLKSAIGAIVVLSAVLGSTHGMAINPGGYALKGLVQSSTATGTAVCPKQGSKAKGWGFYDDKSVPLIPPAGLVLVMKASHKVPWVTYVLGGKYEPVSNKKFRYVTPPKAIGHKGFFSLTPINGRAFTLETKTGSLGKGNGSCDTVYALSFKSGLTFRMDKLFQ